MLVVLRPDGIGLPPPLTSATVPGVGRLPVPLVDGSTLLDGQLRPGEEVVGLLDVAPGQEPVDEGATGRVEAPPNVRGPDDAEEETGRGEVPTGREALGELAGRETPGELTGRDALALPRDDPTGAADARPPPAEGRWATAGRHRSSAHRIDHGDVARIMGFLEVRKVRKDRAASKKDTRTIKESLVSTDMELTALDGVAARGCMARL
jgi:hypothetical protein